MLPYYAYHALNRFNTTDGIEPKFHDTYGADVLFNTDAGNMPRFDCRYTNSAPSGVRPNVSWRASSCYSPDKIQEGVENPQPSTTPTLASYSLYGQSDPEQVMKNAVGTDFFYDGVHNNMKGVKLADNYEQLLKVLNALRYTKKTFDFETNIKKHTRERRYTETGELYYDTGWVEQTESSINGSYYYLYYNHTDNYVSKRIESYNSWEVDFYNDIYMSDAFKGLIENTWYYPYYEIEFYLSSSASLYQDQTWDYTVLKANQGDTLTSPLAPEPPIPTEEQGSLVISKIRLNYNTRFATSIKEMTMEDLANHYQVPY